MFGIPKKGATEVANNEVVKDGYLISDIENALNIDALQKWLNTDETDFLVLWDWLIASAEGRARTAQATITVANEEEPIVVPENGHVITVDEALEAHREKNWKEAGELADAAIASQSKKKRGRPFKKKS